MGLLDGKTAIITGSARGIGRATAELFAAEGAQVTINDIDGDVAEQAAGEIQGETVSVSGDLTKPGACDEVVQKTIDAFGKVNDSSGKAGVTGLTKTLAKEWGQFKINVNAVAFGFVETRLTQAKEKGEKMKAAGGREEEVELGIPEQMR